MGDPTAKHQRMLDWNCDRLMPFLDGTVHFSMNTCHRFLDLQNPLVPCSKVAGFPTVMYWPPPSCDMYCGAVVWGGAAEY